MKFLLALWLLLPVSGESQNAKKELWVTAYYAGWMQGNKWSSHLRPQDIDFSAVTHVVHFSLGPNPDGTINDEGNGVGAENAAALVQAAHAAKKKVLICVGGWNSEQGFSSAASPQHRETFINNLLALVRGRGYDGIDIDWEPLSANQAAGYTSFMEELSVALKNLDRSLLLTVACNSSPDLFARLAPMLDQINIMTYDYSGAWPGWVTWHNAPLYDGGEVFPSTGNALPSIHNHIASFLAAGVPAEKLGIGIDFYGYVWHGGNGTPTGGVTAPVQSWSSAPWVKDNVPYFQIADSFAVAGTYHWDTAAEAAYLTVDKPGSSDDLFISFDDEAACSSKIGYARKHGLGGVIIWELGAGWRPGATPPDRLLKAIGKAVLAKPQ
jgi:chitinase